MGCALLILQLLQLRINLTIPTESPFLLPSHKHLYSEIHTHCERNEVKHRRESKNRSDEFLTDGFSLLRSDMDESLSKDNELQDKVTSGYHRLVTIADVSHESPDAGEAAYGSSVAITCMLLRYLWTGLIIYGISLLLIVIFDPWVAPSAYLTLLWHSIWLRLLETIALFLALLTCRYIQSVIRLSPDLLMHDMEAQRGLMKGSEHFAESNENDEK